MTTVYYTISDGLGHYLMTDPTSLGSIIMGNDQMNSHAQWSGKYIQNKGNNYYLSVNSAGLKVQPTAFRDFTVANNTCPNIISSILTTNDESRGCLMVGNNPDSYLAVDDSDTFILGADPENDISTRNYNMFLRPVLATNPITVNTTTSKPIYATTTTATPISSSNTGLIIGLSVGGVVLLIILLLIFL